MSHPREVILDARWLRTGIGRYTLTLLRELKPNLPDALLTCITMPAHVKAVAPLCDRVIEMSCGIYSLAEQAQLPFVARNAAVFCAPHYNIPVFRTGSLVVTIHDLTHLIFPEYRRRLHARLYAEAMLRFACMRAVRVVTPSKYTKRMLVEHLKADPEKISVVPCAVNPLFRPRDKGQAAGEVRNSLDIQAPYILFVGSMAPHKNLLTLLTAYRQLRARRRDMPPLVSVLPKKIKASTVGSMQLMPGVRCLHAVDDRSLASLYAAASMTVVPSFEEGFGLPVIESMASGTPVICSDAASLPEIAGDAAIYCSPRSPEAMAAAIEQVLDSQSLQQSLAAAGIKSAARFSAHRGAAAYATLLSSITGSRRPEGAMQ